MIKGVSKQILEVTNTDNPYFERVIFFVKPEHQGKDRVKLQQEAESVVSSCRKPPKVRLSRRVILRYVLSSLLFTMTGCALTIIINAII